MGINLNMSNANSFEPLPVGIYDATVYDAEIKDPKDAKEKPAGSGRFFNDKGEEKWRNLNVQFKITSGDLENRRGFRMYNLGPKSQGFLIKFLEALDHTEFLQYKEAYKAWVANGKQGEEPTFDLDHTTLPGYKCRINVKHEPDKRDGHAGEIQDKIADVLPPSAGAQTEGSSGPWLG